MWINLNSCFIYIKESNVVYTVNSYENMIYTSLYNIHKYFSKTKQRRSNHVCVLNFIFKVKHIRLNKVYHKINSCVCESHSHELSCAVCMSI